MFIFDSINTIHEHILSHTEQAQKANMYTNMCTRFINGMTDPGTIQFMMHL